MQHQTWKAAGMNIDRAFAVAAMTVFLALVVVLLPSAEYPRMLGGGAAVFAAIHAIAHVRRNQPESGWSVLAITVAAGAVLIVPGFPAMGGLDMASPMLGFLGTQAAVVHWITLRWSSEVPARRRTPLKTVAAYAMLAGLLLSLLATIPLVIGIISNPGFTSRALLIYPSYLVGTSTVAFTYWLLQGVAHRPVGRYLLGAIGGFCLYAAVAPVAEILEGDPIIIKEVLGAAVVCGFLVGPTVAMLIAGDSRVCDGSALDLDADRATSEPSSG